MAENKGILICAELLNDKLAPITAELLGCGRHLADELQEEVTCLIIGSQLGDIPKAAITLGADKVLTVDDPMFKDYQTEPYAAATEQVIKENNPRVVLFGQTAAGRDIAPLLAFKLGTHVSMDCLELKTNIESKLLEKTRSVYGGNARATYTSELMPQMATIRQKAISPLEPDSSRKGDIIAVKIEFDISKGKAKVLDTVKEEVAGIKLEDANVIVSGGRGIGNPEGFKQLEDLARLLKGAVGASRPPCDNGWMPETAQIGLTGKIVSPELYIAIAISGASQHMAGSSGSKNIIAINKDPEANIFKEARFGVVGDWKQLLPAFTEKVKELIEG